VPRFYLPLDQIFPQTNVSQFILLPKDLAEREELRKRLPPLLAEEFPRCAGASSCCPTGRRCLSGAVPRAGPTQACASGPTRSRPSCAPTPTCAGQRQLERAVKVLRLEVDQDKARALGVTSQAIAQATRTLLSGTVSASTARRQADRHRAAPAGEERAITDLGNAYVPTAGPAIPLTQIAKPVSWEPGVMWREKRNYAITVQGDVVEGLQGATVTSSCARSCGAAAAHARRLPHRDGRRGGGKRKGSARSRPACR
jgi:hypothetical protein